jgi:hypothetical protein
MQMYSTVSYTCLATATPLTLQADAIAAGIAAAAQQLQCCTAKLFARLSSRHWPLLPQHSHCTLMPLQQTLLLLLSTTLLSRKGSAQATTISLNAAATPLTLYAEAVAVGLAVAAERVQRCACQLWRTLTSVTLGTAAIVLTWHAAAIAVGLAVATQQLQCCTGKLCRTPLP